MLHLSLFFQRSHHSRYSFSSMSVLFLLRSFSPEYMATVTTVPVVSTVIPHYDTIIPNYALYFPL